MISREILRLVYEILELRKNKEKEVEQ